MDNKLNSGTPGKLLQNLLLEKTVHNKLAYSHCADSPLSSFPNNNASTPPSGLVKNPFESVQKKRLHQSVISPSLFRTAISNSKTEVKFKWTIDDISTLKPANIDESVMEQFHSAEADPETEMLTQATIDKYFNEKHIVPSPLDTIIKNAPLISESTSPIKLEQSSKSTVDEMVQTVLTLPPVLPDHVEAVLLPYFTYTIEQQSENKDTKLYRRLFEFDDEEDSPNSVLSSPAPSLNLSPIEFSPERNRDNTENLRNYGSDADVLPIPDCGLSPIPTSVSKGRRSQSAATLDFTGRMSVDSSHNWVPDTLDQVPMDNQSLILDSIHSPIPEVLSNSTVNWDMEYRHVSFASHDDVDDNCDTEMDVSKSNTPKSTSSCICRQRKKLSESFLKLEEHDNCEYNKENIYDENKYHNKGNLYSTRDITDAGYHTGSGLTMYEESWSSSQLFASTPTNRNKK